MQRIILKYGFWLILLFMVFIVSAAEARKERGDLLHSAPASSTTVVTLKTAWSLDRAHPGDLVVLAIVVKIQAGFHINADVRQIQHFEDFKPYPTKIQIIEVAEGVILETARFPKARPIKVDYSSGALMSFEDQTIVYLPMKLDDQINPGEIGLKIRVEYQACSDSYCLFPQKKMLKETLTVVKPEATTSKINNVLFAEFVAGAGVLSGSAVNFNMFGLQFLVDASTEIGWMLLLMLTAFGGLLLNFTPCVLPLIPIKIINLSQAAENQKKCLLLGLAMSLGVMSFWTGIGVLIALVSGFSATHQLFQYPAFTILIGTVIGIMSLGMFGYFSVRLPQFIYMISPQQKSLQGSFGLGILAAALSTPCTAPFMGATAAWATTQTPLITLSTFASIGGGMALPYLVLSGFPNLVNRVPKTGPASELLKQIMGLFMLAAAAYFIGVGLSTLFSSAPNPPSKIYWWPVMGFVSAGGSWLAYRILRITSGKKIKTVFFSLGLILVVLPIWGGMKLSVDGPIEWIYYTPYRFENAIKQNKIVVMDFTAEWCLNCKVVEKSVLHSHKIIDLLSNEDIVPMKVDITGNNPPGKAKLKEVGSLTVPFLVVFEQRFHFHLVDPSQKVQKRSKEKMYLKVLL